MRFGVHQCRRNVQEMAYVRFVLIQFRDKMSFQYEKKYVMKINLQKLETCFT